MTDCELRPKLKALSMLLDCDINGEVFWEASRQLIVELRQDLKEGHIPVHMGRMVDKSMIDEIENLLDYLDEEEALLRNSDRASAS